MARKPYSVEFLISAKKAASFNKNFNGAAKHLDSLARKAVTVAKAYLSFTAIKGASTFAVTAASDMENYRDTLNTVLKDHKKAGETMKWATKFANKTPFETDDVVKATVRLESYGLMAKKYLPTVGDMAATMKTDMMQATEAIADAQMGEFERLKEFGINKDLIAQKATEMFKGVSVVNNKGQITDMAKFNEALMAVLEDRFKGASESMANTFSGAMSTIKGVGKSAIAKIMGMNEDGEIAKGSVYELIKENAQKASDYIQNAMDNGLVDRIQQKFSSFVKTTITYTKKIFKTISPLFPIIKKIFETLKPYAKWFIDTALPKIVDGVAKVLEIGVSVFKFAEKHWNVIKPILLAVGGMFLAWKMPDVLFSKTDLLYKNLRKFSKFKGFNLGKAIFGKLDNLKLSGMTLFKDIPKLIGKGIADRLKANPIVSMMGKGTKGLGKLLKKSKGLINDFSIKAMFKLESGFKKSGSIIKSISKKTKISLIKGAKATGSFLKVVAKKSISGIGKVIVGGAKGFGKVFGLLKKGLGALKLLFMSPIAWIVVGIVAVIALGVLLWKNWDKIKAKASEVFGKIRLYVTGLKLHFNKFLLGIKAKSPMLFNIIMIPINRLKTVIKGIKTVFGGIVTFIKGVFTGNWKQAWEGIKTIFKGVFDTFVGIVKAPIDGILKCFSIVWDGLKDGFKGFVNFFIKGINAMVRGINKISFDIPEWVPVVGGKQWGFNIPEIPMLAKGGIATKATTAIIGEGAEPEAVLPLSKLKNLLKLSGTQNNATGGQVVFAPKIIIQGNATKEDVDNALNTSYKKFKEFMAKYEKDKKRLKLA